jgi:lauroyl/myristoyl acyltransferase
MKRDLERLINNRLLRALVRHGGFTTSRYLIRAFLLPIAISPRRMRELRRRVQGYFESYFPQFDGAERRRRARAFVYHSGCKFAEDCITLNVGSVDGFLALVDRLVEDRNARNLTSALSRGTGTLAVGAHVGSPVFGTCALMAHLLRSPADRAPAARVCVEPEVERYPAVSAWIERLSKHYGRDFGPLFTRRKYREIALEMTDLLSQGAFVSTNLDVLMGGGSRLAFSMFGRARVRLPALVGAVKAALWTGATLLPWVNLRTRSGFRLLIEEPIGPVPRLGHRIPRDHPELSALCERLRQLLEGWIAAQPEQWVYWDRWHQRLEENS